MASVPVILKQHIMASVPVNLKQHITASVSINVETTHCGKCSVNRKQHIMAINLPKSLKNTNLQMCVTITNYRVVFLVIRPLQKYDMCVLLEVLIAFSIPAK